MYLDALRVPALIFLPPQSHCNLRYTVLEVANEVLLPTSISVLRDGKSLSTLLSITNFMSALIWTMFPCGCSCKNLKPEQFNHFHKDRSKIARGRDVAGPEKHRNERIPQQHILPFLNPRGPSWTKLTMEAKFISISSRKCTGICLSFHPKLRLIWLCVNCFTKNTPICGFLHSKAKEKNILRSVFNLLNVPLNFSVSLISSGSICVIAFFLRF